MNELTPQLEKKFENARRVVLSRAEKDAMRGHIESFMRKNRGGGMIPSPWVAGRFLVFMHKPVALALVVILALGGGTAYAAEGALPGDALYPVKVDVFEEVVAAVTISDEARVRWDTRRAERRLEEAAELTFEGRMTVEAEAEIEERFEHFAEAVENRTKRVAEKKGPRVAAALLAEFEGKLRGGHERLLARADKGISAAARSAPSADDAGADEPTVMMATMSTETAASDSEAGASLMFKAAVTEDDEHGKENGQRANTIEDVDTEKESPLAKKVRARLEKLEQVRMEAELEAELEDITEDIEFETDDDDLETTLPETGAGGAVDMDVKLIPSAL